MKAQSHKVAITTLGTSAVLAARKALYSLRRYLFASLQL